MAGLPCRADPADFRVAAIALLPGAASGRVTRPDPGTDIIPGETTITTVTCTPSGERATAATHSRPLRTGASHTSNAVAVRVSIVARRLRDEWDGGAVTQSVVAASGGVRRWANRPPLRVQRRPVCGRGLNEPERMLGQLQTRSCPKNKGL